MTEQERRWPQTYWEYAGLGTPEMKQRAKEAGCLNDKEVYEWLHYTYGRRSREKPTVQVPRARASTIAMTNTPRPKGTTCFVCRSSKFPVRRSNRYATKRLNVAQSTFTVDDDSPSPGSAANGVWNGLPMTPATR